MRREDSGKQLRVNERIRISPVRLIDENNAQAGIVNTDEAMARAKAAGLDLVEVAPSSRPPVCRIMDYGKWKYQQSKKEQKAKSHTKHSELKEVRLRPVTDVNDLKIKADRARGFFKEGHKVQFTVLFKGRQMAHRELGFRLCERLASQFTDVAHVEVPPRTLGRRMTMILTAGQAKPKVLPVPAKAPVPAPAKEAAAVAAPVTAPAVDVVAPAVVK